MTKIRKVNVWVSGVLGVIVLKMLLSLQCLIAAPKPRLVEVPLKEYTTLNIEVVPNLGTRLTFPFKLSEQVPEPMIVNTNPNIFQINGSSQGKVSTNTRELVITANAPEGMPEALGNVFISVGGYQISVMTKLNYRPKTHLTDYRFQLSEAKLEYFIEKAVERRLWAEKKALAKARKQLAQQAKNEALAYMGIVALKTPEIEGFSVSRDLSLENGDVFEIYLDELKNYSNEYFMLTFELEHEGLKTLSLDQYQLGYYKNRSDTAGVAWLDPVEVSCPERLMPEETITCALVTTDSRILDNKKLELRIQTSEGELVALW